MKKMLLALLLVLSVLMCPASSIAYPYVWGIYDVSVFSEEQLNLVIGDQMIFSKNKVKVTDDEILIPLEIVKSYIDPNIWWDENLKKVTVTTKDRVIRMNTDSLNAMLNNKPIDLKIPVSVDSNIIYIPIGFLSDFYDLNIEYIKDKYTIIIDKKGKTYQVAQPASFISAVRKSPKKNSNIIKKFDLSSENREENSMIVFQNFEGWCKVRTVDGIIGYIEERYIIRTGVRVFEAAQEQPTAAAWKPQSGKINLVWDSIYSKPNISKLTTVDGLDVISPTWFQVANEYGQLINRADMSYVEWAHKNGYQVWALFSNDSASPTMTRSFLNNTDSRDKAIREILAYAALYKLDGINIDFENIYKDDKDVLTQFIRELTPFLKEQGLMVSMDVTIPDGSDNWSKCYDRAAIGQIVDYVMLMTYDQYWSDSPIAGSIAQITWVEKNLKKVIDMVPQEKLLLGLPFYTRLWKEEVDKAGKIKVTSKVLTMSEAKKTVRDNNLTPVWDAVSGQFYVEYKKDGFTYKIWIEDENSIDLKASLAHKYNLAGTAAWRKADEIWTVWDVLNKDLKNIGSYDDWVASSPGQGYISN